MTSALSTLASDFDADVITPIAAFFEDGVKFLEGDLGAAIQTAQTDLSTALTNASNAVSSAKGLIATTINPAVDGFMTAGAATLSASAPALAPIIAAGTPIAEADTNAVLDQFALSAITKFAGLLSTAAKSTAAISLSNLAGAS
jgi:hypothetical protein